MIIDQIYVISLESSNDRREIFVKKNPDIVKLSNFQWFLVEKDTEDTRRGCYDSHRNVLNDAKKQGFKNILILEDDAYLTVDYSDFVSRINDMYLPDNWNIIQLSYIPIRLTKTNIPHLLAVNCTFWANAYLANVDLLEIPEYRNIPIDCVLFCHDQEFNDVKLNNVMQNTYAYYPMLFYQDLDSSVIGNIHTDIKNFINFFGDSMTNISTKINTYNLYIFIFILIFLFILSIVILNYYIFILILSIIIIILSIMITNGRKTIFI